MSVLVITGTGTGVGKTVVTAALAALARSRGEAVAVVKPAQTGLAPGEDGDLAEVRRLTGVSDLHELARFPGALSPEAAAREAGLPPLDLAGVADYAAKLAQDRDLVLVEGAGGLLVRYGPDGGTLADLAGRLDAAVVLVIEAGLGTLNHTALTLEAMSARGLTLAGVVIGAWPASPGLAERANLTDLATIIGGPLAGALPGGSATATPPEFTAIALAGLGATLGGRFDPAEFGQRVTRTCQLGFTAG